MSFYKPENSELKRKYEEKLREKKGQTKYYKNEENVKNEENERMREKYERKQQGFQEANQFMSNKAGIVITNRNGTLIFSAAMLGVILVIGYSFYKVFFVFSIFLIIMTVNL
jgi:hypothetical protein